MSEPARTPEAGQETASVELPGRPAQAQPAAALDSSAETQEVPGTCWHRDAPVVTYRAASDGPVASSAPAPVAGSAPRYREQREIGRGGAGQVLEAYDEELQRSVALKRLLEPRGDTQELLRLLHEARLQAQLEHPGIVPVHGLGADEKGRAYFTMALVQGRTLGSLLRGRARDAKLARSFPLASLLRIVVQAAYAIDFAHSRGVLHRDLKPGNVMIGRFGEVRVMDWGLAIPVARPGADSAASAFISGTPAYMAPEQARGVADLDERADVYGLGAVLYEVLAGRPPVDVVPGEPPLAVLERTARGQVRPLRSVARDVDRPREAIANKALAFERERRYASVRDLVADLEAYIEGRPVLALEEILPVRLARWYFGRPAMMQRWSFALVDLSGIGGILIGVALGAFFAAWLVHWSVWTKLAVLAAGLAACAPLIYTSLREGRPDDPSLVRALREGFFHDEDSAAS